MGAHSWRDEFVVLGPWPWEEELLMCGEKGFRRVETLEVDFYLENEAVRTGSRGWGEAEVRTAIARDVGEEVELEFNDGAAPTRVSKAALRAMLELGSGGDR